ncbi:MAG: sugar transferase [Candidatus Methylomirabilia bacterium]
MARNPGQYGFRGAGYVTVYEYSNDFFNVVFSLALIVVSAPLFLLVGLLILIHDGWPILYKGRRLGKDKKLFTMYKFRTLVPDAEAMIGPEVLTVKHNVVTPVGKFLRPTRLDELPQLINVLKRDMDLFGPRPQRLAIYEAICRNIKGYDRRFLVKPGLIGYPQLFLPHNAPKRIQSRVDNKFLWKNKNIAWEIFIIFYTMVVVVKKVFQKLVRNLAPAAFNSLFLGRYKEKRELERVKVKSATVRIRRAADDPQRPLLEATLVDINERYFLVSSDQEALEGEYLCDLVIEVKRANGRIKHKIARCRGKKLQIAGPGPAQGRFFHVIGYTPTSPFNYYLILQYFLKGSMVG